MSSDNIMNRNKFSRMVEDLVSLSVGTVTYIDAILEICNRQQIDPLDVNKMLSKPIYEKVHSEAQQARLLKVSPLNTLPL